jgi:hypothetical protein
MVGPSTWCDSLVLEDLAKIAKWQKYSLQNLDEWNEQI